MVIKDLEKIPYEIENPASVKDGGVSGDLSGETFGSEPGGQPGEGLAGPPNEGSSDKNLGSAAENSTEQAEDDPVSPQKKQGLLRKLKKLISGGRSECRKGNHSWNGCVCSVCGAERHEYELVSEKVTENGGCCWSVSDPCIGPDCGTPCDSYYPGREGSVTRVWRCKHCGSEKTEGSV